MFPANSLELDRVLLAHLARSHILHKRQEERRMSVLGS